MLPASRPPGLPFKNLSSQLLPSPRWSEDPVPFLAIQSTPIGTQVLVGVCGSLGQTASIFSVTCFVPGVPLAGYGPRMQDLQTWLACSQADGPQTTHQRGDSERTVLRVKRGGHLAESCLGRERPAPARAPPCLLRWGACPRPLMGHREHPMTCGV